MRYRGLLYRALNPRWAREPLSGEGARRHGGRFNARGTPALYTSLDAMTALREANQVGTLQPTTLIALEADLEPIFDARDDAALAEFAMTARALGDPAWRVRMREDGLAPTQRLAAELIAPGYAGLRVQSFARGAGMSDFNIVLWRWGKDRPARLRLVDDESRLS